MNDQKRQTPMWWLPRYSMRTGLVLFLVVGTGLGLGARFWQDIRVHGDAQKWLVGRGSLGRTSQPDVTFVNYAPEQAQSWFTSLVRKWVHPEYQRELLSIHISRAGLTDEGARRIAQVYHVENITVYGVISEVSLAKIITAPGLRSLHLDCTVTSKGEPGNWRLIDRASELSLLSVSADCQMRESAATSLSQLPNLKMVNVRGRDVKMMFALAKSPQLTEFRIEGSRGAREYTSHQGEVDPVWNVQFGKVLDELAKRPHLKRLRLLATDFNDPTILTNFVETSDLKILHLERDFVTPPCLGEFAKLKKIETLHLHYTPISEEHLRILAGMKTLYGLHGLLTQSKFEQGALEAVLPHCDVNPP